MFQQVRNETAVVVPDTMGRPPVRAWSGVMAFTEDRAPILSFLYRNGQPDKAVVFAVAFNGYGGSQASISGKVAAQMAKSGQVPNGIPDDIFSMKRFQESKPLFLNAPSNCKDILSKKI